MAQYLVTMDLPEAIGPNGALPSVERVVGLIRNTLLPSLESLLALKVQGKVVAGGYPSGPQQRLILIMEAESKEEVFETLQSLPCWNDVVDTEVARMHVLEELSGQ
jgi:nitrate reductase NapAB chaperone NapD